MEATSSQLAPVIVEKARFQTWCETPPNRAGWSVKTEEGRKRRQKDKKGAQAKEIDNARNRDRRWLHGSIIWCGYPKKQEFNFNIETSKDDAIVARRNRWPPLDRAGKLIRRVSKRKESGVS